MWRVTIPQCPTVVGGCNCPSLAEFTITAGFIRGCRTSGTGQWEQSGSRVRAVLCSVLVVETLLWKNISTEESTRLHCE